MRIQDLSLLIHDALIFWILQYRLHQFSDLLPCFFRLNCNVAFRHDAMYYVVSVRPVVILELLVLQR